MILQISFIRSHANISGHSIKNGDERSVCVCVLGLLLVFSPPFGSSMAEGLLAGGQRHLLGCQGFYNENETSE